MRLSAIVRSSLVHVVVTIAVLFTAGRQLDATAHGARIVCELREA